MLAAGTLLGPHRILAPLGAGGMGEVYRAHDTRLGREVAIKVLPPHLAATPEARARFEREARTISQLNHPHICTLFDVGREGEIDYLVMELLEGDSLRAALDAGPIPFQTALDWMAQAARGLAAAHQKGIVHRDLKPENLFLTRDGQVKVLDFGLAKLGRPGGPALAEMTTVSAPPTEAGAILGTVGYMAPEQARGEPAEARADLFALGAILYELLSGKRAFAGAAAVDTLYLICHEEPAPLSACGRLIPAGVSAIVTRCLEKRPQARFQSADDLARALEAAIRGAEGTRQSAEKSIVVLPFENLSPDPENAFFADGLTEELIADLSRVRALRVISRTSAMLLKGSKKDVPTIARELDVCYVLEGSVRRAGTSLRITSQLIDAASDAHLWAEKYSGTLDDVFAIQERVSAAIVSALRLQLTPEEAGRLAEHPVPNAVAFEFYLKARQEILKWTAEGLDRALICLQRGLDITGPNAVLFAGLAYVHLQYLNLGLRSRDQCRKEIQHWLDRVFELEPECPQGHFVLGVFRFPDSPREAIRHLKRVLETHADDFDAVYFLSCLLGSLGQTEAAVALEEKAARLDPLNPAGHFHLGFNRIWEGRFDRAREILERLNREFPVDPTIKFAYGLSLAYLREADQAGRVFDELARERPGTVFAVLGLSLSHGLAGRKSEALNCLEAGNRTQLRMDFQYACWVAECYALIDESEAALDWLERDVDLGMINHPFLSEYDPFFARLRSEPRFRKLMERVKKEWDNFRV